MDPRHAQRAGGEGEGDFAKADQITDLVSERVPAGSAKRPATASAALQPPLRHAVRANGTKAWQSSRQSSHLGQGRPVLGRPPDALLASSSDATCRMPRWQTLCQQRLLWWLRLRRACLHSWRPPAGMRAVAMLPHLRQLKAAASASRLFMLFKSRAPGCVRRKMSNSSRRMCRPAHTCVCSLHLLHLQQVARRAVPYPRARAAVLELLHDLLHVPHRGLLRVVLVARCPTC